MSGTILICGLNGVGKSTIARALAEALGWQYIDIEDLYFPKDDLNYLYANPRSKTEVTELLAEQLGRSGTFVLASVRGDFRKDIAAHFRCVVVVEAPRNIRLQRVRDRSYQKFGARMREGGDLYEQEEAFFHLVQSRDEHMVENWVATLTCPVIRVDGTRPVAETVERLKMELQNI